MKCLLSAGVVIPTLLCFVFLSGTVHSAGKDDTSARDEYEDIKIRSGGGKVYPVFSKIINMKLFGREVEVRYVPIFVNADKDKVQEEYLDDGSHSRDKRETYNLKSLDVIYDFGQGKEFILSLPDDSELEVGQGLNDLSEIYPFTDLFDEYTEQKLQEELDVRSQRRIDRGSFSSDDQNEESATKYSRKTRRQDLNTSVTEGTEAEDADTESDGDDAISNSDAVAVSESVESQRFSGFEMFEEVGVISPLTPYLLAVMRHVINNPSLSNYIFQTLKDITVDSSDSVQKKVSPVLIRGKKKYINLSAFLAITSSNHEAFLENFRPQNVYFTGKSECKAPGADGIEEHCRLFGEYFLEYKGNDLIEASVIKIRQKFPCDGLGDFCDAVYGIDAAEHQLSPTGEERIQACIAEIMFMAAAQSEKIPSRELRASTRDKTFKSKATAGFELYGRSASTQFPFIPMTTEGVLAGWKTGIHGKVIKPLLQLLIQSKGASSQVTSSKEVSTSPFMVPIVPVGKKE